MDGWMDERRERGKILACPWTRRIIDRATDSSVIEPCRAPRRSVNRRVSRPNLRPLSRPVARLPRVKNGGRFVEYVRARRSRHGAIGYLFRFSAERSDFPSCLLLQTSRASFLIDGKKKKREENCRNVVLRFSGHQTRDASLTLCQKGRKAPKSYGLCSRGTPEESRIEIER